MEVTLDKGRSWRLADIEYPEDRYRDFDKDLFGGRIDMGWRESSFCWCFWSIDLSKEEIGTAKDIFVRSMDESMNVQPRDMYWSVLGMMNNPWFRVAIIVDGDNIKFEHPTQPALMPGGWMERIKKAGGDLNNGRWGEAEGDDALSDNNVQPVSQEIRMKKEGLGCVIDISQLKAHTSSKEPWFVVNGEVYDGTKFLESHPGGAQSIVSAAGLDVSEEFLAIRKSSSKSALREWFEY